MSTLGDCAADMASGAPRPEWMGRVAGALEGPHGEWFRRYPPPADGGRQSAVLILFGPSDDGGEDVVLTERSHEMRSHAGQVSFPGGSLDPADNGSAAVGALREANEEIGLAAEGVEIVAELPSLYLSPSDYVVTPVLAWWSRPSAISVIDPGEVARVVRAPLAELTDPARRFNVTHPSGYVGPAFNVDGLLVWGFTAGLLAKLIELAGLERAWDRGREEPLPDRFFGPARPAQQPAPPARQPARRTGSAGSA